MAVEIVYDTHSISVYNEAGIASGWLPGELSERGLATCEALKKLEAMRADSLLRTDSDGADFETTYRTLRRLERAWTDLIRYDDADPA